MNSIQTAIQRPVTVSMFAVATVLFGLVSLDRLALKLLPDISYPTLTIQTDYEDAAPEEIESLITRPIEEAVGVVSGLTRLTSVSRSGQSEVIVEFDWDTNMDLASLEVREKLDLIRLPRDSGKPVILRFDPSNDPIMRLQLYGDLSMSRLRDLADRELKKVLQSASGVAATRVIGGLEEQIRVEIDEKRLAELGLPITEVTRVLTQENLNQAAGSLYDLEANYLVRMLNRFRSVDEIKDLVIRNQAGRQIVLGDLAQVWRGSKEREIITRINGKQSVEIAIYKEGDANTVRVAEAVKARLGTVEGSLLDPQGIQYQVVFNQADFIESAVRNMLSAAALGGLLAILVLFVFLRDLRSTVAIAFSIPLSILATFALMYQTDVTLNIMSLGGIALGVGMLVDNSIVVLEAVHRHRRAGTQLAVAVFRGAREVGMAVTASTLTTVAVFLPLVFVEGIAGQLFRDQALTITYSLLASLVVALTFLPMFLALSLQAAPSAGRPEGAREEGARLEKTGPISAPGPTARQSLQSLAHFIFVTVATTVVADVRRALFSLGSWILRMLEPFLDAFQNGFESISRVYPRVLH